MPSGYKNQKLKPQISRKFGRRFVSFKTRTYPTRFSIPCATSLFAFFTLVQSFYDAIPLKFPISQYLHTNIHQSSCGRFGPGGLAYHESILILRRDTTLSYQTPFPSRSTIELSKLSKYACILRMCSSILSSAEVC